MNNEEFLLGGDIILEVDNILIRSEEDIYQIFEHLNATQATATHVIKLLRAGEIMEFRWVSADFQSTPL